MNENTLLLRQIHPAFIQQNTITSQAFRPTPKDEKLLSVFVEMSNHFLDQQICLELENRKLTETRDILLPKLMSGEIRVEDTIEVE